jgi:chaperonin cofactor prefoldin
MRCKVEPENTVYGTSDHLSERVEELKEVLKRLQKHGPLLEKQKHKLMDVVDSLEDMLNKQLLG